MTINDQIRDETLRYDINWEAAKISAFYQTKLVSMNNLTEKKYCHPIKNKQWKI